MTSATLEALLRGIASNAALPLERALSMAPAAYSSAELHELEQRRVFARAWVCVGRVSHLPASGSWLRAEIGGEPIVVTRDADGELHALSRVCRHRSMDLLAEEPADTGQANRFTCPYHAWTYRLDGSLLGAPEMQRSDAFVPDGCRLPEFRVRTWHGFVFVNLDRGAVDLEAIVEPLAEHLGDLDFTDYVTAYEYRTDALDGNWKSAFENSIEGYHNLGTHRRTLLPDFPVTKMEVDGTRSCVWGWAGRRTAPRFDDAAGVEVDATRARLSDDTTPPLPGIPEKVLRAPFVFGVFPSFFCIVNPTSVLSIAFEAAGPLHHRQTVCLLYPRETAEANGAAMVELAGNAASAVIAEDFAAIEAVSRGLRAPSATSGPLSHHEALLWRFQQYLADQLVVG